jgi:hypothetical protein
MLTARRDSFEAYAAALTDDIAMVELYAHQAPEECQGVKKQYRWTPFGRTVVAVACQSELVADMQELATIPEVQLV